MITEYKDYCIVCGCPTTDTHHLIPGKGRRRLSDEDHLMIPVCRNCHNEIHNNKVALALSRICGQIAYEKWYLADFGDSRKSMELSRQRFRERYGVSYL